MNYLLIAGALLVFGGWRSHLQSKSVRRRILCLLAFGERPLDGWTLCPLLDVSYGTFYAVIDTLEKEGLITGEKREREGVNGPRTTRHFSLTFAGVVAAEEAS